MPRRSDTAGLMVESSRKFHTTVGVLSLPDAGVHHAGEVLMELKTISWRTSIANYRSELVMVPPRLVKLTSYQTMSDGYFTCQAKLVLSSFGSIHTPRNPVQRCLCSRCRTRPGEQDRRGRSGGMSF